MKLIFKKELIGILLNILKIDNKNNNNKVVTAQKPHHISNSFTV